MRIITLLASWTISYSDGQSKIEIFGLFQKNRGDLECFIPAQHKFILRQNWCKIGCIQGESWQKIKTSLSLNACKFMHRDLWLGGLFQLQREIAWSQTKLHLRTEYEKIFLFVLWKVLCFIVFSIPFGFFTPLSHFCSLTILSKCLCSSFLRGGNRASGHTLNF